MRPTPEQKAQFDALAAEFVERLQDLPHKDLVLRMLSSVVRMSQDGRRADLKLTAAALEEMEHSFDILELFVESRKVAIFGSARAPESSPVYEQARKFAHAITEKGFMVITGAGPGVMAAGNEGAGKENSFGMSIRLPHEGRPNRFIDGDLKSIDFKYFFTRKLAFLKDSHAVVLCPGGYGTLDEGFEALTLIQTGKAQLLPLVFLHPEESRFWVRLDDFIKDTLLANGMISTDDLHLYRMTTSVAEACEEICKFYRRYHSMRFHDGHLLLRLTSPVSDEELEQLNADFSDLFLEGKIERADAPEDGVYDPQMQHLTHLRFRFLNSRYGRLRQLIDRINETPAPTVDIPPERGEGGRMPVETDSGQPVQAG